MPSLQKRQDFVTEIQELVNRSGIKRPASTILRDLPTAAVISKLTKPRETGQFKTSDPSTDISLVNTGIDQISKSVIARIEDNENIFRLFPDIELAIQIIISSILSPKDMIKAELIYRTEDSPLPPGLVSQMTASIQTTMDTVYNLKTELPDILRDALFRSGSHVKAILPEAAVDQLINQTTAITTESIFSSDLFVGSDVSKVRNLGLLADPRPVNTGNKPVWAVESSFSAQGSAMYESKLYVPPMKQPEEGDVDLSKLASLMNGQIEVCDNYQLLKMPKVIENINRQAVQRLSGSKLGSRVSRFATESARRRREEAQATQSSRPEKPSVGELSNMLYKGSKTDYRPFTQVPSKMNLARKSIGRPMVMTWPSEAAIPVHVPGDVSKHIGYFVPIDMDGNPISINSAAYDAGQGLSSMLQSDRTNHSLSSLLTEKARRNLSNDGIVPKIDHITDLYADIIEHDLLERLLKGAYGKKLQVSRNNEIYRIMLARTLQSQMTRLVYVPAEYIAYFAFQYHRNGVGKSYLDDLSNITSLRAMVLFSNVMSKVKSSITTTLVNVQLDERDPDPLKTIEQAKHLAARARQQYFPHGLNRVVDLTDWLQRAGMEITFEGHPRLPHTKFNFESKNIQHTPPDLELDEMLRHQTYMHFGLSPETVDSATKTDFATTIEQQSILFARRILMLSDIFSQDLTDYVKKIVANDEVLLEELTKILNDNKGDLESTLNDEEKAFFAEDPSGFTAYVIQEFLDVFKVDLPKPDATRDENQKNALEKYEEKIDKALDYVLSSTILPAELGGDVNQYADAIKAAWKGFLIRKWMADNNYATEAFDISNRSDDGRPMVNLLEMVTSHTDNVMLNIVSFLQKMKATKDAAALDLQKLQPGESSGEPSGGGSEESEEGGEEGGFGDDFAAGNPFENPEGGANPEGEGGEEGGEGTEDNAGGFGEDNPFNA